jgi:hypothetical protein
LLQGKPASAPTSSGSAPAASVVRAAAPIADSGVVAPSVKAFDDLISAYVSPVVSKATDIGGEVLDITKILEKAFQVRVDLYTFELLLCVKRLHCVAQSLGRRVEHRIKILTVSLPRVSLPQEERTVVDIISKCKVSSVKLLCEALGELCLSELASEQKRSIIFLL